METIAQYTIELRRYIDSFSQYQYPPLSVKEKINVGHPHLFDFDYPFFDESKRKDFERKWIRRFYMTEIGFETMELFKFHLENWMNENMPYYNQRFESELIEFNPLMNTKVQKNKDYTKDGKRDDNIDTTGNKNGTFHIDTKDNGKFNTDTVNDGTTHNETSGTMTSDGTVDQNGTTKNDETGTKKGNNKNVQDGKSFDRNVTADTPDKRLQISNDDVNPQLTYASNIKENIGTTHNNEDITIDENTTKNGTGETTDKTVSHDEAKSNTTSDGTTKDVGNANGTTENSGFTDGRNNEDTIGNSKLDRKENEIGNSKEFIDGKIGVETYSEMLEKYRDTFLRIEKEIYEQCRAELFMLAL